MDDFIPPTPALPHQGGGSLWRFDPRAKLAVYLLGCGVILLTTRPLELALLTTAENSMSSR